MHNYQNSRTLDDAMREYTDSICISLIKIRDKAALAISLLDHKELSGESAKAMVELVTYVEELIVVLNRRP